MKPETIEVTSAEQAPVRPWNFVPASMRAVFGKAVLASTIGISALGGCAKEPEKSAVVAPKESEKPKDAAPAEKPEEIPEMTPEQIANNLAFLEKDMEIVRKNMKNLEEGGVDIKEMRRAHYEKYGTFGKPLLAVSPDFHQEEHAGDRFPFTRFEKTEEYREVKPYWINRLLHYFWEENTTPFIFCDMEIPYDVIQFRNGYSKDSPTIQVEYLGVSIGNTKEGWSEEYKTEVFVIKLGSIISRK